jgi:predicted dehydrogenase
MGAVLRVGIVGCGNIAARAHIPAWERCRDLARVVAVADPSEHARNHVGDLVGLSSADRHTDPGDLITRDDIDIIDVCTPQAFRRDVLVDAAAAGKHILCEKPLATTPADADRAVQAADASGVVFAIMHNYLTTPEMIAVRDVLNSGTLGDIRTATVNFLGVVHEPGAAGDWRHDPGLSGGGVLIDMLHGVYVLEALLGQPLERVSAHVSASDGARVEDQAMCRFETAHRVGLVNIAWGAGSGGMTVEGTKGRLEVRYENGGTAPWAELEHVRVTSADGAVTTVSGPSAERRVGDGEFPSMTFGTNAIVRDVAEAIRDGRAPLATGADGLRALEATIAAYASGATGGLVQIPLDREGPAYRRGALGVPELHQSSTSPFTDTPLFRRQSEATT